MTKATGSLAHQPLVTHDQQDVDSQLQSLANLSLQDFQQIIQTADFARSDETDNSTKNYAGTVFYSNLVKAIRDVLATKGFTPYSHRNIELALHEHIAIAVCKGDANTGSPHQPPQSHYKKGEVTLQLFGLKQDDNPLQEKLFPGTEKLHTTGGKLQLTLDEKDRNVWVLVHYSEKISNGEYHVKAELSQPATYDNNGHINSFAHRIILDFENSQLNSANATPEFTDTIDFKVE